VESNRDVMKHFFKKDVSQYIQSVGKSWITTWWMHRTSTVIK